MNPLDIFDARMIGVTIILRSRLGLRTGSESRDPCPVEMDAGEFLELMERVEAKHIVVDCHDIDPGSELLKLFVDLYTCVRDSGGRIAFCNVPKRLAFTMLPAPWAICSSRSEAMAEVERCRSRGE